MKSLYKSLGLLSLLLIMLSTHLYGQGIPSGGGEGGDNDLGEKNFSFMPIPYFNYNRSLGFAFGAIPMAMYKLNPQDTVSPASISGLLGMYTTNKTWFLMGFSRFYFNQDNWRVTGAAGIGSVNFQFFVDAPISGYLKYNTQADFLFVETQRRVWKKLYVGVNYTYTQFKTSIDVVPDTVSDTKLHALGLKLSMDLRDDVYYPHKGFLTDIDWSSYPQFLGNDFASNKIEVDYNHFFSLRKDQDVIAARLYAGFGLGDLAFEQQFIIGSTDIRGYTQGKYRGDQTIAVQGEYRWNFHKKMSAVGFMGLATIFGSINEADNGRILPGVGAGFRYNIFPKYHMNVGMDVAVGRDDWGIYFRVGEAF